MQLTSNTTVNALCNYQNTWLQVVGPVWQGTLLTIVHLCPFFAWLSQSQTYSALGTTSHKLWFFETGDCSPVMHCPGQCNTLGINWVDQPVWSKLIIAAAVSLGLSKEFSFSHSGNEKHQDGEEIIIGWIYTEGSVATLWYTVAKLFLASVWVRCSTSYAVC